MSARPCRQASSITIRPLRPTIRVKDLMRTKRAPTAYLFSGFGDFADRDKFLDNGHADRSHCLDMEKVDIQKELLAAIVLEYQQNQRHKKHLQRMARLREIKFVGPQRRFRFDIWAMPVMRNSGSARRAVVWDGQVAVDRFGFASLREFCEGHHGVLRELFHAAVLPADITRIPEVSH